MSSRSFEGEEQRVLPGSTASGPAPAARGRWESSGTQAQSVTAAATASAAGAAWAWERRTGSARSATPTGAVQRTPPTTPSYSETFESNHSAG